MISIQTWYNWVYNIQIYRTKNIYIVSSIKVMLNNNISRNKLHQLLFL